MYSIWTYSFLIAALVAYCLGNCDNFKCDANKKEWVSLKGFEFECPETMVCNIRCSGDKTPCITPLDLCEFECLDGSVCIGGNALQCLSGKECNSKCTWPGEACVEKSCPKSPIFACNPADETLVSIQGMPESKCVTGTICNADNIQPCTPCIQKPGGGATTTTEATITTTQAIAAANCNDGSATVKPCRKGNNGSYFRCKLVWYWYEYDTLPCSKLNEDVTCRQAKGIC